MSKSPGPAPFVDPSACVTACDLGPYTEIGARSIVSETDFGAYSYVAQDAEIIYTRIGRFVSIAAHTRINPGNHPMIRASQHHFSYRASAYGFGDDDSGFFDWRREHSVEIGHDTWIGHGAVIMPGRRVGIGAVVGAGTIVTHDVPDYAICIGNPGRVLRYRFPEAVREALMRIAWWNWSHEALKTAIDDFRNLSIEDFCNRHDTSITVG